MGLRNRLRRILYIHGWRLRHWWLDTPTGKQAQIAAFCLTVLFVVMQLVHIAVEASRPQPPGTPMKSIYWWVIELIIVAVQMVISYFARPRPKAPAKATAETPNADDGQYVKHHFGTCWVDDSFVLAWKMVGTSKIKTKGGKK